MLNGSDHLSPERRSWNMGQIKGKDTKPEMAMRRMLHAAGFRFRLYRSDLPGKPDIVLPKWHTVIFVHGCFWHRHEGCKRCTTPTGNKEYWEEKFRRNVERDAKNKKSLEMLGWGVLVIWECEVVQKDSMELLARIENNIPKGLR